MSDTVTVQALLAASPGPRVTKEGIEARIASVAYHRLPETTLTICVITMSNGFNFTGESACVSPENFNETLGNHYAYEDAFKKIWSYEAYLKMELRRGVL